jgi:iron complex outermembrane recepter protein
MKTFFLLPSTFRKRFAEITIFLLFLVLPILGLAQEQTLMQVQESDTTSAKKINFDEVLISAIRVTAQTPVTFSNLKKEDFQSRNLGQDIPIMMNYLPSVVTTTDAGAGVGYTGIRVRGSDATRVNVTLNGIPYNDAESQGTFWVNMPDFASSTENLQLQRGVGTSTNGAGAFGASLNILTDSYSEEAKGEISNSFGSFNTRKHTVKFSTGLLHDKFELAGRLSQIASDGYIDRAFSDLKGYFLQGTYVENNTLIKALVFGGKQRTYQAWYGIEDQEILRNNRTFNVAGMYFDDEGNMQFYDNEVDNYQQDHYQLHWNERWNNKWSSNLAFHYTIGKGYFEQYRQNDRFSTYGLTPITVDGEIVDRTDLIRRRWLDNDFYGTTYSVNYKDDTWDAILGGGWNRYEGAHFGEIIWARFASQSNIRDRYYDDFSTKTDFNIFSKFNVKLTDRIGGFLDLQYRRVHFTANAVRTGDVDDTFNFFNPKAGITYKIATGSNLYASIARAHREPNRNDYEGASPKPERLDDLEVGWRWSKAKLQLNVNGFYMLYENQLVLTGELNDVGAALRANVGDSYRMGIEIDALYRMTDRLEIQPNIAFSRNRNRNFLFERDGVLQNLGETNIAFSPNIVAGNRISYTVAKGLTTSLFSKFVGEQYMGNIDAQSSLLNDYFINDLNISYDYRFENGPFTSVVFNMLVNNIFDIKYISNGYFYTYDDDFSNPGTVTTVEGAGYYPQATRNFLLGMTLNF